MWTAPRTWTALEVVTAKLFNQQVSENMNLIKANMDNSGYFKIQYYAGYYGGVTTALLNANSGAGETDLSGYTFTIPSSYLSVGEGFHLQGMVSAAANTNAKTLRLDIAGQKATIWASSANVAAHIGRFDARFTCRSNTGAAVLGWYSKDNAAAAALGFWVCISAAFASLNFSQSQTAKLTAQGTSSLDLLVADVSFVFYRGNGQAGS